VIVVEEWVNGGGEGKTRTRMWLGGDLRVALSVIDATHVILRSTSTPSRSVGCLCCLSSITQSPISELPEAGEHCERRGKMGVWYSLVQRGVTTHGLCGVTHRITVLNSSTHRQTPLPSPLTETLDAGTPSPLVHLPLIAGAFLFLLIKGSRIPYDAWLRGKQKERMLYHAPVRSSGGRGGRSAPCCNRQAWQVHRVLSGLPFRLPRWSMNNRVELDRYRALVCAVRWLSPVFPS
jgi:hypothetical protein